MNDKTHVFLGMRIPAEISYYLSLYCLVKQIGETKFERKYDRSKIVRQEILNWYNRKLKNNPEPILVKKLLNDIQKKWIREKEYWKQASQAEAVDVAFDKFIFDVRALYQNKIKTEHINHIIDHLEK